MELAIPLHQNLREGIRENNLLKILEVERKLDFPMIVSSGLQILKKENEREVAICGTMLMDRFMKTCFPNQEKDMMILEFVEELIQNRYTWNLYDIPNLFKFIRQNQHLDEIKVNGNTLTFLKFQEMIVAYESHRAQALEQERIKGKDKKLMFSEVDKANGKKAAQFMESLKAKLEAKKLPETVYPDENIFQKPRIEKEGENKSSKKFAELK